MFNAKNPVPYKLPEHKTRSTWKSDSSLGSNGYNEILFEDLPAIPLWYSNVTGGYAETVENVTFGWNSVPLYEQITKSE